jgi:isocitrate lyase
VVSREDTLILIPFTKPTFLVVFAYFKMASFRQDRFSGIKRDYTPETVRRLSGSVKIEYTLAKRGAEKLWDYMTAGGNEYINVLGALTGKV